MRRCTVLGAGGYIGRRLSTHMRETGWDCLTPSRGESLKDHGNLGVVFYCVGLTADFRKRPFETVEAHVGLLKAVLETAEFDKLIYLSSTRVYLGAGGTDEEQQLSVKVADSDDLYKLSKLMGESLALHCGRPCAVARLSNVVGGQDGNPASFVYELLREARLGEIVLRSPASTAKDYIHVDDVATLLGRLAGEVRHRIYNLASGHQVTHAQWAEAVSARTGCKWRSQQTEAPLPFLPVRNDRVRQEFGYQPRPVLTAIDEAIIEMKATDQ